MDEYWLQILINRKAIAALPKTRDDGKLILYGGGYIGDSLGDWIYWPECWRDYTYPTCVGCDICIAAGDTRQENHVAIIRLRKLKSYRLGYRTNG